MVHAAACRPLDWMHRSRIEGLAALVAGAPSPLRDAIVRMWQANGGVARAACADDATRATAVEALMRECGRMDLLVHAGNAPPRVRVEAIDDAAWDRNIRAHVRDAHAWAIAYLPALRLSASPAIVHVASLAAEAGAAGSGSYGPAQAALVALTRQMAVELGRDGVRVNAVNPGFIEGTGHLQPALAKIPLGRAARAEEVAAAIVFLGSPAASFVTGQVLNCDGGLSQSLYAAPMSRAPEPR